MPSWSDGPAGTPFLQHSNTPILQYSNTPTLQYSTSLLLRWRSLCIAIRPLRELFSAGQSSPQQHIRNDQEEGTHRPTTESRRQKTPEAGGDDIDERHGQHEFPGEVHQLVHP